MKSLKNLKSHAWYHWNAEIVTIGSKALDEVVRRQVASDHGWDVIVSILGHSRGDELGAEAIIGLQHERRTLNTC